MEKILIAVGINCGEKWGCNISDKKRVMAVISTDNPSAILWWSHGSEEEWRESERKIWISKSFINKK